ncbi:hypothetical protein [Paludibaculum fermentans]|uniref:hypothetical protein n=1 Tax=Paludibaculum fermentans TaxID=1473598 RepID=UPI003EBF6637
MREYLGGMLLGLRRGAKSPLDSYSTFSDKGKSSKWLFNGSVLRSFEGGWRASQKTPESVGNLLRLCLLGAAMDNCNAVADGKCLRYRKDWQVAKFDRAHFEERFQHRVEIVCADLEEFPIPKDSSEIYCGDARRILTTEGRRFKLCVTSPPYLNSFDYSDVYRPELFLGKFVDSTAELALIRKSTIRSHVQARWELPERSSFGPVFSNMIAEVRARSADLWDKKIPTMIQAYFEDMERILLRLRRLALPEAAVWIVVATSAYAGVEVPVDFIIAEIAERSGWYLSEVGVLRHLRSSGQHINSLADGIERTLHLRESVVILKAARCS